MLNIVKITINVGLSSIKDSKSETIERTPVIIGNQGKILFIYLLIPSKILRINYSTVII